MFKPLTVSGILKDFELKKDQLRQVAARETEAAKAAAREIEAARAKCLSHEREAERANLVASRIQALVG